MFNIRNRSILQYNESMFGLYLPMSNQLILYIQSDKYYSILKNTSNICSYNANDYKNY